MPSPTNVPCVRLSTTNFFMNDVCRKTPTVGKMFAENLKKKLKFSKIYRFVFILSIFARIFKLGIISIATLNDFSYLTIINQPIGRKKLICLLL